MRERRAEARERSERGGFVERAKRASARAEPKGRSERRGVGAARARGRRRPTEPEPFAPTRTRRGPREAGAGAWPKSPEEGGAGEAPAIRGWAGGDQVDAAAVRWGTARDGAGRAPGAGYAEGDGTGRDGAGRACRRQTACPLGQPGRRPGVRRLPAAAVRLGGGLGGHEGGVGKMRPP